MPIGNQIQYTDNVASKIVSATATASQTTFTIVGGYRVNAIAVYKQGLRLSNGVDFTATDGSTVVLTSGATLNDKMVFQIYDDFNVADISAAPGDFTVGADLSVSGTISGDGSGLTGVASTENVSTSTLNVVGVATIGKDVRVARNLNVSGITTFTDGYGTNLYLTNLSAPIGAADVLLSGTLDVTTGLNVRAGVSTLGTSQCDSLTVANAGITFSGGTAADVRNVANLNVTGVSTFTGAADFNGNVYVGTAITMYASSGIVSATTYYGDGSQLSGVVSGITVEDEGSALSTLATTLDFVGSGVVASGTGATKTITISGGGGALASRTTKNATTASLAAAASGDLSITAFKAYNLLKIAIDHPAWVRLYVDAASRTSDASRAEGTDPTPGSGVIAEVLTTTAGASTFLMSPAVFGWNNDGTPATTVYAKVTNKEASTSRAITVTLTLIEAEA